MSDIKLFKINNSASDVNELVGTTDIVEKSVQLLFERNLPALLGIRFLASEFKTSNGGRIDTLGLDENGCPVILEYKRASNENVINQGLFYLDWLMGHRKDFEWLVMQAFGEDTANKVDWSAPRLVCIAGDFNRYDTHAVKQIQRSIELFRYRRFGAELLMLDLVTPKTSKDSFVVQKELSLLNDSKSVGNKQIQKQIGQVYQELNQSMNDRFESLRAYLFALGDDVQETRLQFYFAFKRFKNFACVEFRPTSGKILMFLKIDPKSISLEQGFTRDVSNIGHYGTGDLEITLSTAEDLDRAKLLIERSYSVS